MVAFITSVSDCSWNPSSKSTIRTSIMNRFKSFVRSRLPFPVPIWKPAEYFRLITRSSEKAFIRIYRENKWRDKDSRSGPGSNLIQTEAVRKALPLLIGELNCKSLLDVPCGDFFWMKMIKMNIEYIGGDIVAELIENNRREYGSANRRFLLLNLVRDSLPKADLILCRDCLVHFSYSDIFRAVRNIKSSGSIYFLTTTFVDRGRNENIPTGRWRPINLQFSPFNFPAPTRLIDEKCPDAGYRDKSLGLWKIADLAVR